ncbi:MAG: 30S ribosomal protein S13 [Nanoarchaeota archaeon]|nr:30S ribosomal protein S13 [Nanoarchaeota archaeon]
MPKKEKEIKKQAVAKKPEFKKIIRIADTDLDASKKIEHALISIKGVSWSYAHAVRKALGLDNVALESLPEEDIERIKQALKEPQKFGIPSWLYNRRKDIVTGKDYHLVSSDLVLSHNLDLKRLKSIKCYRGIRHMFNYKVRGQRTRSRGANVRGRVGATVGVVRRKQKPGKK